MLHSSSDLDPQSWSHLLLCYISYDPLLKLYILKTTLTHFTFFQLHRNFQVQRRNFLLDYIVQNAHKAPVQLLTYLGDM